jgi:glycerol-3-phosphate cytidylyltransferase-like family protein
MSVEYDNRSKKIHDDAFPLNYILPAMALGALIFLVVTFIFNKDKEHKTEVFPQLKEHRIRLIRPDGAVDKIIKIYKYEDSTLIFSSSSGNLCVYGYDNDRDRYANTYIAPIGWNLEPVNENEE